MCRLVHGDLDVQAEFDTLSVAFFYGPTVNDAIIFALDSMDEIGSHKSFNRSRKTVFYIHGFRESVASESCQTVVEAFLKRNSHNILVLDWSVYASGNYVTGAVPNLVKVLQNSTLLLKTNVFAGQQSGRTMHLLFTNATNHPTP